MKAAQNIPLVANPDQIATHWPNVATDHSLPFRHALTEATVGTVLALVLIVGGLIVTGVREPSLWALALFVTLVMFLFTLLKRYEDHIAYVRSDRRPEAAEPDLNADGKPDRMHGVWYGNGAPPAAAGSLDNAYRYRFAEFCAACRAGDTSVRYLRSSGFDDGLQALFRSWLMQYQAANWVSAAGHNPGWELGDEAVLRKVLRNTAWAEGE